MAFAAFADGAPASQFGFSGWPYRQETDCTPRQTVCPTATSEPVSTPKPAATVQPPVIPSEPTRCPIQEPTLTPESAPTAAPTQAPVISPVQTPEATAAPTETLAPTSVPTKRPTQQPVPTVAETPEPTRNPVIATPSPSTGNDYTTGSITAQEENAFLLLNQDRAANGLSALTLDPSLCALARLKSQDMNANQYLFTLPPLPGQRGGDASLKPRLCLSPPVGRISPTTPPWRRRRPRLCPYRTPTNILGSFKMGSVSAYARQPGICLRDPARSVR
ncbi:MAG: CAP domain-containing protein [Lachnospiraceae bacterium]